MSIEVVTLNTSQMSTVVDRTLGSNSDRNEAAANDVLDIINISIEIVLPEVDMDLQHNTGNVFVIIYSFTDSEDNK